MRVLFLAAALLAPLAASAAVDIFVQFDSQIAGTSVNPDYQGWIEVSGVSWGGFRLAEFDAAGERMVSGAFPSEITLRKRTDTSSPDLFVSSMTGEAIATVAIDYVRQSGRGPEAFASFVVEDVVVTSFKTSVDEGDDTSEDVFTLHYGLLRYSAFSMNPDGSIGPPVTRCFDPVPGAGPSC